MQPSNSNSHPLPQDEEGSIGEALPLHEDFCDSCNRHEAEETFEELNLPVERDPLQIEMERIEKVIRKAVKKRKKERSELAYEYQKEVDKLVAKYNELGRNADTKFALAEKELEKNYETVLRNMVLAEASRYNHEKQLEEEQETGPSVRACNNPMIQSNRNLRDDDSPAPAPPLGGASTAASRTTPTKSEIPEWKLPPQ